MYNVQSTVPYCTSVYSVTATDTEIPANSKLKFYDLIKDNCSLALLPSEYRYFISLMRHYIFSVNILAICCKKENLK